MVDVNLSPTTLDVFGGPASIDVSIDFGKTGDRGSRIWVGNGNPATVLTSSQDVKIGDLYINTNTSNQYYSWLYTYVESVSGAAWERALKLNPQQHSMISTANFIDGTATINIPLTEITSDTAVSPEQFMIRYDFENSTGTPVSSSFKYSIETISTVKYLQIIVSAIKYSGSAWSNLTGSNKVHLFVSYLS